MGSVWQYRDQFGYACSPLFSSVDVANAWVDSVDVWLRESATRNIENGMWVLDELEVL